MNGSGSVPEPRFRIGFGSVLGSRFFCSPLRTIQSTTSCPTPQAEWIRRQRIRSEMPQTQRCVFRPSPTDTKNSFCSKRIAPTDTKTKTHFRDRRKSGVEKRRSTKEALFDGRPTKEALFDELEYTAELLRNVDPWNKYAWSHRQWVLQILGRGYADELGFCGDISFAGLNTHNRLIWDQRCFAVQKCLAKGMAIIRSCEILSAASAIKSNPADENPWRYLRFLFKNDMKALAQSTSLQWVLTYIFVQARDCANTVREDKEMYKHYKYASLFDSVNKRGCLFALDLVSDLLKHEYKPDNEFINAFKDVFKEYNGNTIAERVESVLREHRMELMELCADFTKKIINEITGGETTPGVDIEGDGLKVDRRSPLFPRSELRDKAGYSCLSVSFIPDDPDWRTDESNEEGRGIRSWPTLEVTKDDRKDIYSDLPESLRSSCREIEKYSDIELINHTNQVMAFTGYVNPTVWKFRRLAVHIRGLPLENEMQLLDRLGETISLDNYLFWHQRRWVSEYIGSDAAANNELKFTEKVLTREPYNHYAWSHRQWVRQVFFRKDWGKAELDFCTKVLKKDASNALAWNQRYFVIQQQHPKKMHEMRGDEAKYAIAAIHAEPENEMPWIYLKCLVSEKNYKVLKDSSTFVLSNVVRDIKEGEAYIRDAYVKKRVVNALKMVLLAVKRSDFKPNHDLKTNIDYLCPPEAAEKSFEEKVVSILCSMDVTCM
ncbi:hypothetical protein CASFOL_019548 [Castilleja foliolosa]|uniref:Protein farnesyltransferase/geranylgeranyltransferase type-1 subunit alpha n=1 Tax=Castilleja foliolosa TaxID=1961234 RepID=A0ABD3D7I7_9LAMI